MGPVASFLHMSIFTAVATECCGHQKRARTSNATWFILIALTDLTPIASSLTHLVKWPPVNKRFRTTCWDSHMWAKLLWAASTGGITTASGGIKAFGGMECKVSEFPGCPRSKRQVKLHLGHKILPRFFSATIPSEHRYDPLPLPWWRTGCAKCQVAEAWPVAAELVESIKS